MKTKASLKILSAIKKKSSVTGRDIALITEINDYTVRKKLTILLKNDYVKIVGFKQNRNGKSRRYGITTKGTIELMPRPSSVRPGICKSEIHEIARLNKSLKAQERQIESIIESAKQNGRFGVFINQFI